MVSKIHRKGRHRHASYRMRQIKYKILLVSTEGEELLELTTTEILKLVIKQTGVDPE